VRRARGGCVIGDAAHVLRLREAIDRLCSPFASEDFSSLTGAALLVVDLEADDGAADPAAIGRVREALATLPCPSVALRSGGLSPLARRLESRFDVVVTSEQELAPVREGVAAAPLAALALVQLLRHGEQLDVESALLAESLVYSLLQAGPEFAAWRAAHPPAPAPAPRPQEPAVRVERDGSRLTLTLNRPERHNAFSAEMRDALVEGLRVASDPGVAAIELAGAGPSFCSGGDLAEFGTLVDPVTAHAVRSTRNAARLLAARAHCLHARVHGACIGAGVELPAFAARVTAHASAWFQLPELRMGLVPGAGGTVSIPRRIGRQRAAWLALSGERIDAALAWRWGLVDEISGAR
jgi:hypothetical protein